MFCANSCQIIVTAGDTGLFCVIGTEKGYTLTENDRVIFTVRNKIGGKKLIEKVVQPDESGAALVPLMSEDTEKLKPQEYFWDIRVALDAQEDADGNVTAYRELITPIEVGFMLVLPAIGGTK